MLKHSPLFPALFSHPQETIKEKMVEDEERAREYPGAVVSSTAIPPKGQGKRTAVLLPVVAGCFRANLQDSESFLSLLWGVNLQSLPRWVQDCG